MQLSCMESSSGLTAQPLFLWITQANFDNFSKKSIRPNYSEHNRN